MYEEKKNRKVLADFYLDLIDKNIFYIDSNNQSKKWLDKKMAHVVRAT
jgi:hypothetical protein